MPRGRILVADDNPDILRLVEVNLRFEDYEVLPANDGEEALETARRELPDLIILDVMMGRMDGWQVLGHLKADPATSHIPIIIMTGSSLRERRQRELVQGVADYLPKPFTPHRLVELVNEHLQGRRRPFPPETRPRQARTRVVVLQGPTGGAALLQNLLGHPAAEIVAVIGDPTDDGIVLARDLALRTFDDLDGLPTDDMVDVYVDGRGAPDADLYARAVREGAEVLGGRTLHFVQEMLAARDAGYRKERDLVRELKDRVDELSIMNDMARLAASPFDLSDLYDRALNLTLRIADLRGGCVLVYDEEVERFVPVARVGLSERFEARASLPLSDPMVDELLTMRRPLTVAEVDEVYSSALMGAAAREPLASLACLPLMVKDKVIGILVVGTHERHVFRREEMTLLTGLAAQLAVLIENARLQRASVQKQALIEKLLGKVIQGQEDERKRLAAEIHDGVAQSLAGMLSHIQVCQALLSGGDTEKVCHELASIRTIIADSVREVRQIIFNLRPSSLDDLGLIPSIENYVKRFARDTGIEVTLDVEGAPAHRLPSTLETTIFRIVQESLTNIKKHARASTVRIRLATDGHQCSLRLADNGIGFKWLEVTDKFYRGESHGVEGMKERAALLGGTFRIQSREGEGTVVHVDIPVPKTAVAHERPGSDRGATGSSALAAVGNALARLGQQALGDAVDEGASQ